VGDLGGGVKAQGSGDAGLARQGQAGQTSQGLFSPGREPNSYSGAVTTVTQAIQVAAQIGYLRLASARAGHGTWREGSAPARRRPPTGSAFRGVLLCGVDSLSEAMSPP